MPTKTLPARSDLRRLDEQALELIAAKGRRDAAAAQRIREFHPRFRTAGDDAICDAEFQLADARLAIAREHGFSSWARLATHVEDPNRTGLSLPYGERIADPAFRDALALVDAGDAEALREHLRANPALARERVTFEGGNYFSHPALLEFVAENPTRNGRLPDRIADVARAILDAGAKDDREAMNSTLELVSSSRVARESGHQRALIDLLCDYGAAPGAATYAALLYGEFDAVETLLRRGAPLDLVTAVALGRSDSVPALLACAGPEERQRALAMSAQVGRADVLAMLLDAGADPNRYAPVGGHSHATPLHQAVAGDRGDAVALLVERGARLDIRDVLHNATPLEWAEYLGRPALAEYLRR